MCQKVKGLPYNKYSWLTTHNSFARIGAKSGTGSMILAPSNQQDSITSQLIVNILLHHSKPISKVSFINLEFLSHLLGYYRMVLEGLCLTCTTSKTIYGSAILTAEIASITPHS